jgi:hypothetical protein
MLWEPFGEKVELVLDVAVENDHKKVAPLAKALRLASASVPSRDGAKWYAAAITLCRRVGTFNSKLNSRDLNETRLSVFFFLFLRECSVSVSNRIIKSRTNRRLIG